MKHLCIFFFLLFTVSISNAQQAGQLIITSYDDTGEIGYVCNGQPENSIPVSYALINLNPSIPLTIDSIVPHGDSTQFQDQTVIIIPDYILGEVGVGGDAGFAPTRAGDDTMHETVYYNGQFTATASIIFHARNTPTLAFYGFEFTWALIIDGEGFASYTQEPETDTMFDTLGSIYTAGLPPLENGGNDPGDQPVLLRTCGGATIDSIYEVGDFSDFSFDPFPPLPYTMSGGDSLLLNYEFTPKVVDTAWSHHYLVFHSTDGQYLVWSFTYWVYPTSSVNVIPTASDEIKVFPNPATDALQILGGQVGTIHLYDLMGRERMNANDDGTGATLDVSHLESGTYFLRLGNQSTKVEISR
jgi:Secretion system C-terminal sorting domain